MSQVQPPPVHWVHRALAMRGKSVQKRAAFSCFETFSTFCCRCRICRNNFETWDILRLFVSFCRGRFCSSFVRLCEANAPVAPSPAPEILTRVDLSETLRHHPRFFNHFNHRTAYKSWTRGLDKSLDKIGQGYCAFRTNCKWCKW